MLWFLFCAIVVVLDWRHTRSVVSMLDADKANNPERDHLAEELVKVFDVD